MKLDKRMDTVIIKPGLSSKDKMIENMMMFMDGTRPAFKSRLHGVDLSELKEAEPLSDEFIGERGFLDEDFHPSILDRDLDHAVLIDGDDHGMDFQIHRFKRIYPHEVRGRIKLIRPYMVEQIVSLFTKDGIQIPARFIHGYFGTYWDNICGTEGLKQKGKEYHTRGMAAHISMQFDRRYFWRAVIGRPGLPSVSINTNPTGAKELFKLRDIPEGKQKRPMLRNWISEHWRTGKIDYTDSIKIKEHLRGNTQFKWNGFEVKIIPSDYDVEQLNKIKLGLVERRL